MHGFWMFWIVALVFWSMAARRRQRWAWRRWEMMGPPSWWYGPDGAPGGPWSRGVRGRAGGRSAMPARREPTDDEPSHVEALESRIAELEQRLDFTERLLAGRGEKEQ
jgi:hypothetical protein